MARTLEAQGIPEVPGDWVGSKPEWFVYWALIRLGFKNRFTYQSAQLGGRLTKGGAVIDFMIEDLNLAINIQSSYYHYRTIPQRARGEMQRAQLESVGIRVIWIDEESVLRNPIYYVSEAIKGNDHSRMR